MCKQDRHSAAYRIGKAVAAALLVCTLLIQPAAARGGSHGGGFHGGGGFHSGFRGGGFHGRGFHGGFAGRHFGGFGGFHAQRFRGGSFNHRHFGFRRGIIVAPVFGGLWAGAGLGWPYTYPYESYYSQGPYAQYWYCENPPGYYPSVTQCNTGWQMVPAN